MGEVDSAMAESGKVFLVGAGPGDPGLLTLRGAELLREANLVLYDYLVNPALLGLVGAEAECICLGRHGRESLWSPQQIQEAMVSGAKAGKSVVRLKGGDPLVFGRAAGELESLRAAGIPFEIVPGITAGLAAAGYVGVPVTHREVASAVALVTGQEGAGKDQPQLDYHALARFPGTIVMYMGITTAEVWTRRLMDAGMPPETPVLLVRRCTWANQQSLACRLDEVAERVTPYSKFPPPAIAIIGDVAAQQGRWNWFDARPLHGVSVLVTRPRSQAQALERQLSCLGADVQCQPAIRILSPESWDAVDQALDQLGSFDDLIFSSANGVEFFCDRWLQRGLDFRSWGNLRIVAVGPGTAAALRRYHLIPDWVPRGTYRAESVVEQLGREAARNRCLLVRASRGRDVLPQGLRETGADVTQVVAYRSVDVASLDPAVEERLAAGQRHWVTATSSSIARALVPMLKPYAPLLRWVSISPLTSEVLRENGIEPTAEAKEYTMDGVVRALLDAVHVDDASERLPASDR